MPYALENVYCLRVISDILRNIKYHVALLQECIVHGEGGTHALWLVALLCKLQVFAEHRAIIRMRTVLDNLLGTAQWALATKIGYTLFGDDHIHIVLGPVYMARIGTMAEMQPFLVVLCVVKIEMKPLRS